MEITREFLEKHKAELIEQRKELDQQRSALAAEINALVGAIRNCDFLISKLNQDSGGEK